MFDKARRKFLLSLPIHANRQDFFYCPRWRLMYFLLFFSFYTHAVIYWCMPYVSVAFIVDKLNKPHNELHHIYKSRKHLLYIRCGGERVNGSEEADDLCWTRIWELRLVYKTLGWGLSYVYKARIWAMIRPFFSEFFDIASWALSAQFYGARWSNSELDKKKQVPEGYNDASTCSLACKWHS